MKNSQKVSKLAELQNSTMEKQLNTLQEDALESLKKINNLEKLKELEVEYLGRKGKLTEILRGLKDVPAEQKPLAGQLSNKVKTIISDAIEAKKQEIERIDVEKSLNEGFFDTTAPSTSSQIGTIHPVFETLTEVENIFSQMGFTIADGPEIESEYYNFTALNIPDDHPARDMQDTFFVEQTQHPEHGHQVLRTQTSPVQIRAMKEHGAPLRLIAPGRVFRNEATDASHDSTFHQVEGLLIDKDISIAHLKGVLEQFLTRLFDKKVSVRFRPGYFPFVEPGFEVDFSCLICEGKGCRVCKHLGWVEFMGAGMVHPNVLKAGEIDSEKYQGWAFGFGLTRLVMMRYKIPDIRLLTSGDLRFLKQF